MDDDYTAGIVGVVWWLTLPRIGRGRPVGLADYDDARGVLKSMGQDLIIHLDYQKLIKRLKLAWRAKDVLLMPHYWSYQNVGFVRMTYEFASIYGGLESVCFTLEGDGPLFLIDNRTLRAASVAIRPFKWEDVGSIINLNGLRLRIVTEYRGGLDYLVMFPNAWSVMFYYLFPISRWFDKIYRRLILTADVWGLADCPASEIPYWGHLKWFKGETNE